MSGAFNFIRLLAVMSSLLPCALCALAEVKILLRTGRTIARLQLVWVATLGGLGFCDAPWTIRGSGTDAFYCGFLLIVAGFPVQVFIRWRTAKAGFAVAPTGLFEKDS